MFCMQEDMFFCVHSGVARIVLALFQNSVETVLDRRRRERAGRGYMLPLARVEHGMPLRQ